MQLHLRVIAVIAVAAGLIGVVLALTVLNTEEGSNAPDPGTSVVATGQTGTTGEGPTLDYAQAIPLPINGPLLGVNLTAYTADGYSQSAVKQGVKTLADLGSTAITLVPTWYMKSSDANQIAPVAGKTPTDESLSQAIGWIRAQGMQVVLKPHVDVIDDSYRGDIQPSNRDAWFRSYGSFIDHYATFAGSHSADLFVVGTELKSMSTETEPWQTLIRTVRDRFMGPVTYAANWDELDQVQFWSDLDAIGVDAYYPLSKQGVAPTLESLTTAWRQIGERLEAKSKQWQRPVLLTEVGFPSQVDATATPYEVTDQPADQNIQAMAYRAVFDALSGSDWLQGISWWSWRADPSGEEDNAVEYTPEGKKAQGELAAGQVTFVQ